MLLALRALLASVLCVCIVFPSPAFAQVSENTAADKFASARAEVQTLVQNKRVNAAVAGWVLGGGSAVVVSRYLYLGYKNGMLRWGSSAVPMSWYKWQQQPASVFLNKSQAIASYFGKMAERSKFYFLEAKNIPYVLAYQKQWNALKKELSVPIYRILEYNSTGVAMLAPQQEQAVLKQADATVKNLLRQNKWSWLGKNKTLEYWGVYNVLFQGHSKEEARWIASFVWDEEVQSKIAPEIHKEIKKFYRPQEVLSALQTVGKEGDLVGRIYAGDAARAALKTSAKQAAKLKALLPIAAFISLAGCLQKHTQETIYARRIAQNPGLLLTLSDEEAGIVKNSPVLKETFLHMADALKLYSMLPAEEQAALFVQAQQAQFARRRLAQKELIKQLNALRAQ